MKDDLFRTYSVSTIALACGIDRSTVRRRLIESGIGIKPITIREAFRAMTYRAEREAALLRKLHAEADRAEFELAELKASLNRGPFSSPK